MKKLLRILTVCILLFSISFSLVGCNQQVSGTYEAVFGDETHYDKKVTFEFVLYYVRVVIVDYTGDETETTEYIGTYQLGDGTITFRFNDFGEEEWTFSFSRETVDGKSAIRIGDNLYISTELKLE
ncbi:MAG: hypothetical protein E7453_03790 [Ruminococcaceae bacterium]|nr:hypothetical protein [Oscillospiraceae bacterium]